jgi:hypothetical protein
MEEDNKLYLFTNIGPRLHQKIALAIAEGSRKPKQNVSGDASKPSPPQH